MNTEDTICSTVPLGELLAGLAEEAAELAQAALKYRRALTGTNPTPVSAEDARAALLEEIVDVEQYINLLGVRRNREDISVLTTLTLAKRERWAERLWGKEASIRSTETDQEAPGMAEKAKAKLAQRLWPPLPPEQRVCTYCGDSEHYYAKGLCRTCYNRAQRTGTPERKLKPKKPEKPKYVHPDLRDPWPKNLFTFVSRNKVRTEDGPAPTDYYASAEWALRILPDRERMIIERRLRDGQTYQVIADEFSLSKERVRQILTEAARFLRHPTRYEKLIAAGSGETAHRSDQA